MTHVRRQVRDAAVALLNGLSGTDARVYANRVLPLEKDLARSITIRTPGEQASDISMDGTQQRSVTLVVAVYGKGSSDVLPDDLDASAVLIEEAFAGDPTLGGIAQTYEYRGAELALDGSGEKTAGTLSLTFDVTVYTALGDPETAL